MEILYRDLVKRAEVLLGGHLQIALHRNLAQQAASTENLSRRSCARSSTEILTKVTCRILPGMSSFTTRRVALVLLACSH